MSDQYCILRDGELIAASPLEWARWFETSAERLVARSEVGDAEITTLCMGMMPPGALFKTVIYGGRFHGQTECYSTLEAAMFGHERLFGKIESEQS